MRIIRRSMFETNSSSIHSIVIGDSLPENTIIPDRLEVCELELGRDFAYDTVQKRYTIAIIMAYNAGRLDDLLSMLNKIGVREKILCKATGSSLWLSGAGIEAQSPAEIGTEDCKEYIEEILESEDSLKRWLFSPDSELSGQDDNDIYY